MSSGDVFCGWLGMPVCHAGLTGMPSDPQPLHSPASSPSRAGVPRVARLDVDRERIEQMWQLTAAQRVRAAYRGNFTLGEMLKWAAHAPHEVPLVDGEFFFITHFQADDDDG
jgi:hypothetical protein